MKRILFLRNVNASWAVRDRDILKEAHTVYDSFVTKSFYLNPSWIINLFRSDVIFCWFASLSFFPLVFLGKIVGKRIIIVSGGFDAAYAPVVNYGAFTKSKANQWLRRKLFSMADKVLCVSNANMLETIVNAKVPSKKCEVIYHGFEPSIPLEQIKPWNERKNQIVMISQGTHDTFYLKGLDQFFKLAAELPDYDFILMGRVSEDFIDFLKRFGPKNLKCTGFIKFNSSEFCDILNNSKYILQLSYYESFGCSVIDGAIAGCFPIAYSQFALSELIKFEGKIFQYNSIDRLKNFILNHNPETYIDTGKLSKKYLTFFSLEKRNRALTQAIKSI